MDQPPSHGSAAPLCGDRGTRIPAGTSPGKNMLVVAVLLVLFLALSAFATLSLFYHDRDALNSRMLSTARVLGRMLVRGLGPPPDAPRMQQDIQDAAAGVPNVVRISVYVPGPDGALTAVASTWPSRIGSPAGPVLDLVLSGDQPQFSGEKVGGLNTVVLRLPLRQPPGDPGGLLELAMALERPAGMAAGLYASAVALLMALLATHFLRQQRSLSRELAGRRSAEAELLRHSGQLENEVRDRTSELTLANRRLEHEVARRMRMAEELRSSLSEKETLLQEIHHRVKNNLQIVVSLLDLASRRTDNSQVHDLCTELSSKVHGISLVHSQLYQSETLDSIDMAEYVGNLNSYLVQVFQAAHVSAHLDTENLLLPIAAATPLGMVLNELLTNAYKHAFKDRKQGELRVGLSREGDTVRLRVADDGPGIPEDFDPAEATSLGMRLMNNIVAFQLMGSLRLEPGPGTVAVVEFSLRRFARAEGKA
ncbi:sensor histidine kinase [Desulfocurvus sp. DL9XJH121]